MNSHFPTEQFASKPGHTIKPQKNGEAKIVQMKGVILY
jgi:hypothetical protein